MPVPLQLLERFHRKVFIETGMHRGDAIQAALTAEFEEIYSCDLSVFALGWCCHRFRQSRARVNLHLQDSRVFLETEMRGPGGAPAVFWLDAHYCGGNGEVEGWGGRDSAGSEEDHPLLEELRIISTYGCKTHTIMIDDARMLGSGGWPTSEQVFQALREINPDYQIIGAESALEGDEILVAYMES